MKPGKLRVGDESELGNNFIHLVNKVKVNLSPHAQTFIYSAAVAPPNGLYLTVNVIWHPNWHAPVPDVDYRGEEEKSI
jgi:hypothetical protein